MPNPITHLVLSQHKAKSSSSPIEFLVGTIIPDVDFLKKTPREKTHLSEEEISVPELVAKTKFNENPSPSLVEGFIDHSRIDLKYPRNVYISSEERYSLWAVRFLTDELLYKKLEFVPELVERLNKEVDADSLQGVPKDELGEWLRILGFYISRKPSKELRGELQKIVKIPDELMLQAEEEIDKLRDDKALAEAVNKAYLDSLNGL